MSYTLVKDRDVVAFRNEESYSHNAVVELLQNGEMVCTVQAQARRKHRTHYDPTSRAVLLRPQSTTAQNLRPMQTWGRINPKLSDPRTR